MISNEEQRELLKEIKKRPDVRKLDVAAKVCFVLGWVGIVFGFGVILLIVGGILARKRESRINQVLAIGGAEQAQKQDESASASAADGGGEVQSLAAQQKQPTEKDEKQAKIEELVSISKRIEKTECLLFGILTAFWIALLFLPFGKLLGLENVSVFSLWQDQLEDGAGFFGAINNPLGESTPSYVGLTSVLFLFMGIPLLIMFVVMLIILLIGKREEAIRGSGGEIRVALTKKEIQGQSVAMAVSGCFMVFLLYGGGILACPISLYISMKELLTLPVFTIVASALLLIASLIVAIAHAVITVSHKKEYELIRGITSSYKRYKRLKNQRGNF